MTWLAIKAQVPGLGSVNTLDKIIGGLTENLIVDEKKSGAPSSRN